MVQSRKHDVVDYACRISLIWILLLLGGCASGRYRAEQDPLTSTERLELGVLYEKRGDYELALKNYTWAAREPVAAEALTYRGNVLIALDRKSEAEKSYRQALEINPYLPEALNNLAWYLIMENKDLDEAERLIDRALNQNPSPRAPYLDTKDQLERAKRDHQLYSPDE